MLVAPNVCEARTSDPIIHLISLSLCLQKLKSLKRYCKSPATGSVNMDLASVVYAPALPTFFFIFLFVYLAAFFVVFRNWGPEHRTEASSSFMSLAHGTPAVVMAVYALCHSPASPTFASPNSSLDNMVLEFSMAYFVMDLIHYIVFFPRDILFILHHLATLYVFVTCRYIVHHGGCGLLVLLILAEITSPCQNVWSISRFRRAHVPAAAKLYEFLSPPFFSFYSVVRGILGPLCVMKMLMFYLGGGAAGRIPGWAWISWMVVITTAIMVSIIWVSNNWKNWLKERKFREEKKLE